MHDTCNTANATVSKLAEKRGASSKAFYGNDTWASTTEAEKSMTDWLCGKGDDGATFMAAGSIHKPDRVDCDGNEVEGTERDAVVSLHCEQDQKQLQTNQPKKEAQHDDEQTTAKRGEDSASGEPTEKEKSEVNKNKTDCNDTSRYTG